MNVDLILLIVKIVGLVASVISVIVAFVASVKGGKWKCVAKTLEPLAEQTNVLMKLISEAEQHTDYDGNEKFSQVLIRYALYCMENKIPFNEEQTTERINTLVGFTNKVNAPAEPLSE